jgi:uncharacterized membrane protein
LVVPYLHMEQRRAEPVADPGADAGELRGVAALTTNQLNGLIHLYRAEMGRLTAFRTRLDTTTSWTVTTTALVSTFALGNKDVSHAAFIFLMFVLLFFLQLEARRYAAYEQSRYKVMLLERSFYPELLGYAADPNWQDQLVEALRRQNATVNHLGAMGWRLRRSYAWIYAAVLITWIAKLNLETNHAFTPARLEQHAAIGHVPGWLVLSLVGVLYLLLGAITAGARRIYPLGDDEVQEIMRNAPEC